VFARNARWPAVELWAKQSETEKPPLDIEQTFVYYLFIERMSDFHLRREQTYDDGAKIQRLERAAS
jgi:hypothetical protein